MGLNPSTGDPPLDEEDEEEEEEEDYVFLLSSSAFSLPFNSWIEIIIALIES